MNSLTGSLAVAAVTCGLGASSTAMAGAPSYSVKGLLPGVAVRSVDLSPDERLLYVMGLNDGGLLVFDTGTSELVGSCDNIPSTPWKYRVSADGKHVWTARYYGGLVSKIDPATCEIVETYDVGSWPVDVMFDTSKRYLMVGENHPGGSYATEGSLQIIDTWTSQMLPGIPLHGQPGQIAMAPKDRYVFVLSANLYHDTEKLYKIDMTDWSVTAVLDLPALGGNVGISVHPDLSKVFVPRKLDGEVLVVDAQQMIIEDQFAIAAPSHLYVAPDGNHALVLHDGLSQASVVDLGTYEVTQDIEMEGSTSWNRDVTWSRDGDTAYVAQGGDVVVLRSCLAADADKNGWVGFEDVLEILMRWGCGGP